MYLNVHNLDKYIDVSKCTQSRQICRKCSVVPPDCHRHFRFQNHLYHLFRLSLSPERNEQTNYSAIEKFLLQPHKDIDLQEFKKTSEKISGTEKYYDQKCSSKVH